LIFGGTFFAYFHRSALSIAAPFVAADFGLTPAMTGVLLSAFFWTYALAQLPSGWLVDRFGVGRAYAAGFLVWAAAAATTGLVGSFAALVLLRIVMGGAQGVVFPAGGRAIANWFSGKERGGATGTFLAGVRIGQATITAVGAGLIATYGWRWFFPLTAVAGLVWLVPWIVFHWRYEREPIAPEVAVAAAPVRESLRVLRDVRMSGIFVTFFAVDYVWLLCATWLPGYFLAQRGFSPSEMVYYVSLPLLVAVLPAIAAGIAGDALVRRGWSEIAARKLFVVGGMVGGCVIGGVGLAADGHVSSLFAALSIWSMVVATTNIWALTQVIASRERMGLACGAQNFIGNVGGVIAPIVTGVIAQWTGSFAPAFLLAGALLLVGAIGGHVLIRDAREGVHVAPARSAGATM